MRAQGTVAGAVEFAGRGLHSGENVKVRVLPAREGTGVEFVRTDLPDAPPIPAHIRYYTTKDRRSHLERGGHGVDTIEHLLAVCNGLKVDNLRVEMSGSEMPGLDGSARTLVTLFDQAGIVEQSSSVRVFRLEEPIFVRDGTATLVALPAERAGLTVQYIASFSDPEVEGGSYHVEVTPETFAREIAPARTFCLASE